MILEFTNQADYFRALLPEIVLALWAMLVLMVDVFQKGSRSQPSRPMIPWLAIAGLGAAALANVWLLGYTDSATTGLVAVDGFRIFTNFIFLAAAAMAILLSIGYLERKGMMLGEYFALILFATVGMMILASARELMLLFLGLEMMSVAIYVLVGMNRLDRRSAEGALKYFMLGAFSSGFLLYGIALVFGSTGSTSLGEISPHISAGLLSQPMLLVGIAMLLVGLAFKVAAIPFHVWTPDAYDGAPTPITALMSTGVKAAAFAAFIRLFAVSFAGAYEHWAPVVAGLAVITMFGANLIALTQGSVKRMLAYSSIAHAGYLLVALVSANAYGAAAFLFYLLVYTFMTAGAFGVVIANAKGSADRVSIQDYAGLGWQQPFLAAAFSVLLLSLAGFPLTAGFIGKVYILRSALEAGNPALAVALVLASLISYFYYLRIVILMYMRPAASDDAHTGLVESGPTRFAIGLAAVAVILLFFVPGWVLGAAQQSVASLFVTPGAFFGMLP